MSKKILLLGFSDSVLADAQQQLARPDLEVFRGKSADDVRSLLSQTTIDHVFIGGKLAVETHLEIAWEVRAGKRRGDRASAGSLGARRLSAVCPGSPSRACPGRGVTGSSHLLLSERLTSISHEGLHALSIYNIQRSHTRSGVASLS